MNGNTANEISHYDSNFGVTVLHSEFLPPYLRITTAQVHFIANSLSHFCSYRLLFQVTMRSLIVATLLSAVSVLAQPGRPGPNTTAPEPVLEENGFKCFLTTPELRDAVDAYLVDPSEGSAVAQEYGWPIGEWCVRNIADFSYLFDSNRNPAVVTFNEDLTGWVTTCARDMSYMFAGASEFNGDVTKFQTGRVLTMAGMFEDAKSFNGNLGSWDVFNVQNFQRMFGGAESFEGNGLEDWDTRCAEDISYMFYTAFSFNADLSAWEVSNIRDFHFAFDDAKVFSQNLCPWTESITNLEPKDAVAMFTGTSCPEAVELEPVLDEEAIGEPLTVFCFNCTEFQRRKRQ
ncbi:hypothetical protein FisN_19Lh267 [Fistulifera solaris]|uniref:BspA family leucine-rich repeat surface protein n=1 Tax=Fistulifera solaris TaxID=1519565 RepID=A0A1Z5K7D7_FISSO|nr:hypothetical protein FisN_19Lh267 [Fistulifera solaris]|eukprot:GAX22203.1 hypothetical protein FisN_19Lh267 [Fistulifera solaris]